MKSAVLANTQIQQVEDQGLWIGGVCCGEEIATGLYAQQIRLRRYVIRELVRPGLARRIGEVCGGLTIGEASSYQATRITGEHVALRKTLLQAAQTLQENVEGEANLS